MNVKEVCYMCSATEEKKRRVSEILVSHIPEDEALLLKNGKYACTLCPHRPVLDTIEMLAMHRKGKRHLISEAINEAKTPAVSQNAENPLVKAYIKKTQRKNSFTAVVEQSKRSSTTPSSGSLWLRSGWKLDRDGKWVKDENVEFDSDEEEPPPFVDESGDSGS
ncbi:hypothetical protein HPB51_004395 [Rhipicephalus microplus]|uniref:Sodium channel modifier 1 n=1 Tax=Rhipicephalus microplus TaxID=6941 RepID=A0A9J6ELD9_RHIMP|nr:hypothetical protein HPB51_004395 [Rhipicephalus microplus]